MSLKKKSDVKKYRNMTTRNSYEAKGSWNGCVRPVDVKLDTTPFTRYV